MSAVTTHTTSSGVTVTSMTTMAAGVLYFIPNGTGVPARRFENSV